MTKSILRIAAAAITALICAACTDNNATGGADGFVDRFNQEIKNQGTGGTPPVEPPPVTEGFTLNVTANPTTGGSVTKSPDTTSYADGDFVKVTATPFTGYRFNGWLGADTGMTNPITILMNRNKNLIANFTMVYVVTFSANGGIGTIPSVQLIDADNSITLPNNDSLTRIGYTFDGWNADSSGTGINYSAGSSYTPTASVILYAKWNWDTTFVDGRDGTIYKKVAIGGQVWMAENLNYDVPDNTTDVCYQNSLDGCAKYGRMYNWQTAMNNFLSSSSSIPSEVRGICPAGWHLPSDAEWTTLVNYASGENTAGKKLKSTSGWNSRGNGTDDYGFSALPGGSGNLGGSFINAGNYGIWWSATQDNTSGAWYRYMYYGDEKVSRNNSSKTYLRSVRCVQN